MATAITVFGNLNFVFSCLSKREKFLENANFLSIKNEKNISHDRLKAIDKNIVRLLSDLDHPNINPLIKIDLIQMEKRHTYLPHGVIRDPSMTS